MNNPYIVQNPLYGKCYKAAFRAKKLILSYLIKKLHAKSRIPKKASKKRPLTKVEKRKNRLLSIERILIENMNAKIKVFKIFSQKYRNRRKRHLLRMSLVCGIYNFEL
ncbi:transposase family protein [Bacillus cereus]|uniref:transposase family protein n=1 Tax=Bacillus cereus TaxID=1396 RepID=UPI003D18B391